VVLLQGLQVGEIFSDVMVDQSINGLNLRMKTQAHELALLGVHFLEISLLLFQALQLRKKVHND